MAQAKYFGSTSLTALLKKIKSALDGKSDKNHTHNYAGSSSAGGAATSAVKLNTSAAGSSTKPVYFNGGKPVACTYSLNKTVPADAVFTDHIYENASADSAGLMSPADYTKLSQIGGIKTITKSLKITTAWMDTGIVGADLATGTWVVQVSGLTNTHHIGFYQEIWSGVFSWYSGTTNSTNAEEIFLHNAGHADGSNELYLRTTRVSNSGYMKLQIATKVAGTGADSVVFKFRQLI